MHEQTKVQAIVQQLNIIDDTLFQKMAEDPGFCEEVISTVLEQKVIVKKVTPQNSVKNLQGRSDVLDALCELETGEVQDNGLQEIYVNTKIDDGTDIAELMHIFTESDAYDFEKFPRVSKRKKQFKENEGGNEEVCDLVENYAMEKAAKEAADSARKLFENGVSYEIVRASITTISDEDLREIYKQVTGV